MVHQHKRNVVQQAIRRCSASLNATDNNTSKPLVHHCDRQPQSGSSVPEQREIYNRHKRPKASVKHQHYGDKPLSFSTSYPSLRKPKCGRHQPPCLRLWHADKEEGESIGRLPQPAISMPEQREINNARQQAVSPTRSRHCDVLWDSHGYFDPEVLLRKHTQEVQPLASTRGRSELPTS